MVRKIGEKMTIEERAEKAVEFRRAHTHSCCQSVAAVLNEDMAVDKKKIASVMLSGRMRM